MLFRSPFNFTAMGAVALFSGATYKDKRIAFTIPMLAMLASDFLLGFHPSLFPVYACFGTTVFLGRLISSTPGIISVASLSLASSLIFFLVTNLPIWYTSLHLYPLTLTGTIESYTMALPFFGNQVAGDFVYNALLFGSYHWLANSQKAAIA